MALKRGFSLIELTVVIGLLSLLTLTISAIMLTSISASNRIRTATKVKQAGSFTIGQIQGMLRGAKEITACDSENNTVTILGLDGGTTLLALESDSTIDRIASNSGVYLTPETVNVSGFTIHCEPQDDTPTLVKVAFDLESTLSLKNTENPQLHFETSANLRN